MIPKGLRMPHLPATRGFKLVSSEVTPDSKYSYAAPTRHETWEKGQGEDKVVLARDIVMGLSEYISYVELKFNGRTQFFKTDVGGQQVEAFKHYDDQSQLDNFKPRVELRDWDHDGYDDVVPRKSHVM